MHDLFMDEDKADEKTKVLSHIIDGYLIEESLSPFPNTLTSLTCDQLSTLHKRQQEMVSRENNCDDDDDDDNDDNDDDDDNDDKLNESDKVNLNKNYGFCEFCGVSGPKASFLSPSRRFCTLSCARRFATSHSKRRRGSSSTLPSMRGKAHLSKSMIYRKPSCSNGHSFKLNKSRSNSPPNSVSDSSFSDFSESASSNDESVFSCELSPSPEPALPSSGTSLLQPMHWSVDDVWKYIRSLSDSCQYAEEFRSQEIDGSALLLLHEEHLITSMNLPLGPALKLCAHIDRLRLHESS